MPKMTSGQITSRLLLELPKRFPCRAWRQNTGAAVGASGRMIRFGVRGQADITGIIDVSGCGVRLEIEVKAGRDQPSEQQVNFGAMIERMGGIYVLARDVEGALDAIEQWRSRIGGQQQ